MVADLMPASSPSCISRTSTLKPLAFRPARIHAQQHVRPILALGAAGAGMDFEVGVVGIGLARKQRLDLARADLVRPASLQRCLGFGDDRLIVFSSSPSSIRSTLSCELRVELADRWMLSSSCWRSRISFCASCGSFHRVGSSARVFS